MTASGTFFCELYDWLMRPFDHSTVSPNPRFKGQFGKTEIYRWSPDPVNESMVLEGIPNKVRPPILQYLGHILAHPNSAHKARSDYMGLI